VNTKVDGEEAKTRAYSPLEIKNAITRQNRNDLLSEKKLTPRIIRSGYDNNPPLEYPRDEGDTMKKTTQKLTLDRPENYQIKVPGLPDKSWSEWATSMIIEVENEDTGQPITSLTGKIDQAALQGLLRRLYSLGLPLISVNLIEEEPE
jgi:hypothetical protein